MAIIDVGGGPAGEAGTLRYDVWLERVVRPFESPRILALRARRKAREEDQSDDSLIRWGRPSEYGTATQTKEESRGGFSVVNSSPSKTPQDPNKAPKVYTEVSRTTETVRVTNPSDANQYVDVARITSILFRGPDGKDVRFDLKPPPGNVAS
jgi:hypothetical protein